MFNWFCQSMDKSGSPVYFTQESIPKITDTIMRHNEKVEKQGQEDWKIFAEKVSKVFPKAKETLEKNG